MDNVIVGIVLIAIGLMLSVGLAVSVQERPDPEPEPEVLCLGGVSYYWWASGHMAPVWTPEETLQECEL